MKKLILLAIGCLSVALGYAQEKNGDASKRDVNFYSNEVSANVGFFSLSDFIGGLAMGFNSLGNDDTYQMSDKTDYLPTLGFSYARQFTPLINVSLAVGYSQMKEDILYISNLEKAGYKLMGCLSFMPYVRFDWVKTKYVRCYSRLGLGVSLYLSSDVYYDDAEQNSLMPKAIFAFDVVPFGLTVGRNIYGFAEAGFGTVGFVKGGLGYRF